MKVFKTYEDWQTITEGGFQTELVNTFRLRADGPVTVYWMREGKEEIPVAYANREEITVEIKSDDALRSFEVRGKHACFIAHDKRPRLEQRIETEKYVSLDRPSPLSPEMAAIQRMMKQNEIERDNYRYDMAARERRFEEKISRDAQKSQAAQEEALRKDRERGGDNPPSPSEHDPGGDLPEPPQTPPRGKRKRSDGDQADESSES